MRRNAAVVAAVVTVSVVEVTAPDGVTVAGAKLHDAPEGNPEQLNETAESNPFSGVTEIAAVPLCPAVTVRGAEEAATEKSRRNIFVHRFLKFELLDVFVAMNGAWLINSAMIIMAAVAFGSLAVTRGMAPVASIEDAHNTLGPLLGNFSALIFAVALLCSGLSSSTVGVMAGQVIIEGFLDIKFSIFLRRFITIIPAIIVIAIGLDPLKILILSQVILSFTLPFALIPLLILTGRAAVMKEFPNGWMTQWLGWLTTAIIIGLNVLLIWELVT